MVSTHIAFKECNTFCQTITPTVYDFVNDFNHGYKFCLTFCSRMRLSIPGMTLPTQGIHTLGDRKIHTS